MKYFMESAIVMVLGFLLAVVLVYEATLVDIQYANGLTMAAGGILILTLIPTMQMLNYLLFGGKGK